MVLLTFEGDGRGGEAETSSLCAPTSLTYPKVDFNVTASTKFSVPDLICDGHFVVAVELFVEALPRVCAELNVVSADKGAEACQSRHGGSN